MIYVLVHGHEPALGGLTIRGAVTLGYLYGGGDIYILLSDWGYDLLVIKVEVF